MRMLNVACGSRYHNDWINIDFSTVSDEVKRVNILSGLPFKNGTMDVVYSSHFIEHLLPEEARFVINEMYRVLKPDGIMRLVVPDLENICMEYLKILSLAQNQISYKKKYEWITTELLDQMVRRKNGGEMSNVFKTVQFEKDSSLSSYILSRTGDDLLSEHKAVNKNVITVNKIITKLIKLYIRVISLFIPGSLRKLVFVNTSIGEKHAWMYDKFSLKCLVEACGFERNSIEKYNTSSIKDFDKYFLDIKSDGSPYKGNSSIYLEGIK